MMRRLLAAGLFNLDQFRHAVERLPRTQYLQSTYYQRWLAALEVLVNETGAEVPRPKPPQSQIEPAFRRGDRAPAMATGQAAGVAAFLAASGNGDVRSVDVGASRRMLKAQGAITSSPAHH